MFRIVWLISLLIRFDSLPETYGAFISDLDEEIDETYSVPLEVGFPCEFNRTLSSNERFTVNATLHSETFFTLVEVHSFLHNVSLSTDSEDQQLGTDIGLIILPKNDSIQFSILNPNKIAVKIIGFITPHNKDAPIPGATIKPQLELGVTKNLIKISAQPAVEVDFENQNCSTNSSKYRLFYMHTTEKDFSIETYFEGIRTMIYPEKLKKAAYEYKVPLLVDDPDANVSVLFANYPGTGIFFSLLAEGGNTSSMYVTAHTFGCNYTTDKDSCVYLVSTFSRVEVIILCVAGLILCFCGYEWKSFELSLMTFLLTSIITYAILYNLLPIEENIFASIGSGLVMGCILIICVSYTKWLHVRHVIAFSVFGLLFSSTILFFSEAGNSAAFRNDEVYWATFTAIATTSFVVQYINRTLSHYFTTSLIGSFMAVLTLDYFAGSSIKFIILDNIRRLSVNNFTEAYMNPPFQTPDVLLVVLWISVAALSSIYQFYSRHSRFRRIRNQFSNNNYPPIGTYSSFDETSPLLHPDLGFISDY